MIPTATKVALIDALARTGLRRLELTSFVRADVIPQLADAAEVLAAIDVPETVSRSVLIPNERGLDNALALRDRFDEINVFMSASETHNRHNVNRSVEESLAGLERVLPRARAEGLRCEAVISVAFGCPYEGHVDPERVFAIAEPAGRRRRPGDRLRRHHRDGQPAARSAQFFAAAARALPELELTAHFHNTRGQGLANVFAALEAGIDSFESSFGELGGCPVPPGRHRQRRHRGRRLDAARVRRGDRDRPAGAAGLLARASRQQLGRPLGSHTLVAGPVDWHR